MKEVLKLSTTVVGKNKFLIEKDLLYIVFKKVKDKIKFFSLGELKSLLTCSLHLVGTDRNKH